MPDRGPEFRVRHASGTWRAATVGGPGTVRVDAEVWEVREDRGGVLGDRFEALGGASWRGERLTLFGESGRIDLEGGEGVSAAWVAMVARAAALPEFTRGLRTMGSRRGGEAGAQAKYFAPLLQARRRLEDEGDLDRRLEVFNHAILAERMSQAIGQLAEERFPALAPERRALEAELNDASERVFASLRALGASAARFRSVPDESRFDAWRGWVSAVTEVFTSADRSWAEAARTLPSVPTPRRRRRWWRGRGGAVMLASLASAATAMGVPPS